MRLAFIGLGTMGGPMAANLQRAGHEVRAHDLRRVEGFNWFAAAPDAVQDCELLFTSVPGPDDVDAVAAKLKPVLRPGTAWFDLSTNSPSRVRRLHGDLAREGVQFLDAPVSGGPSGAKSGKLAIWVGGERATYERYESVLRAIGDQPLYIGAIGAGTVAKLAHNCGSFAIHAAMAEIFTLGVKAGVEPLALFRALRQGATGRKRTFDRLAEHFLPGKYDPAAFSLRLAHKDATLALELAREAGVPMKIGQIALDELSRAIERGWIDRDFRAAMTLQEERAGVDVRITPEKLRAALEE
ncbi:MAG: NAD(P)-dependent oxidoreductase [Betaproteobacteria bacterium]|nr:MAG: NAD(P)-dependent oxidoreductase [Betaproteobacteria bacterium]